MADFKISWQNAPQTFSEPLHYSCIFFKPVGELLVVFSSIGLCYLGIINDDHTEQNIVTRVKKRWPHCTIAKDLKQNHINHQVQNNLIRQLVQAMGLSTSKSLHTPFNNTPKNSGLKISSTSAVTTKTFDLHIPATAFEKSVWENLLQIPTGNTLSYSDIARQTGNKGASRAVGSAVGRNPVSLLIPCHRVIRADGSSGHYLWGSNCKRLLLALESQATTYPKHT